MFPDPTRKNQRIQPTHQRHKSPNSLLHTPSKHLNRQHRPSIASTRSRPHLTHIVRQPRQPRHPRIMIQHPFHSRERSLTIPLHLPQQIKHQPRIQIPRPRPHHHPTRRGQPHRRIHRPSLHQRRHAATATKMRNHHPPRKLHLPTFSRIQHLPHNRLATQPMKPIPPHPA